MQRCVYYNLAQDYEIFTQGSSFPADTSQAKGSSKSELFVR